MKQDSNIEVTEFRAEMFCMKGWGQTQEVNKCRGTQMLGIITKDELKKEMEKVGTCIQGEEDILVLH